MYEDNELKDFIHNDGLFKLKIPYTWRHVPPDPGSKVHTFREYEMWKSDAFQVSMFQINESGVERYRRLAQTKTSATLGDYVYSVDEIQQDGDVFMKIWTTLVNDIVVILTLTSVKDVTAQHLQAPLKQRIEMAEKIVKSFQIIPDEDRKKEVKSYRFAMFIQGVGASVYMLSEAVKNQAFIEATCLLASQIDGLLRIGIVLQTQLNETNSNIDLDWIYQSPTDQIKSEKDIYRKALEMGIISEKIFETLFRLYGDRNRVVHRFVISEITIAEVEEIAYQYYKVYEEINAAIFKIEEKQIEKGVGMTTVGPSISQKELLREIKGKIGKQDYFKERKSEGG